MKCLLRKTSNLNKAVKADILDFDSLFSFVSDETFDTCRNSPLEVFLGKSVLKMLLCNFAEIELWHGCSPIKNLLQNTFS